VDDGARPERDLAHVYAAALGCTTPSAERIARCSARTVAA
jgi:hypothetical protein